MSGPTQLHASLDTAAGRLSARAWGTLLVLCGAVFLDERLAAVQWLGVAIVLAGLVVNVFGARWFRALRVPSSAAQR